MAVMRVDLLDVIMAVLSDFLTVEKKVAEKDKKLVKMLAEMKDLKMGH